MYRISIGKPREKDVVRGQTLNSVLRKWVVQSMERLVGGTG